MTLRVALSLSLIAAPVIAQNAIPVRTVAPPVAATTEKLGTIFGLREMPDGRVLVSDAGTLRLMLFAADLKAFDVLSDTTRRRRTNTVMRLRKSLRIRVIRRCSLRGVCRASA